MRRAALVLPAIGFFLGLLVPVADLAVATGMAPVVVIVMENHSYAATDRGVNGVTKKYVVGNPDAPYLNSILIPSGRAFTNYYGVTHPSLPNYVEMVAGTNAGCTDDFCLPDSMPQDNLFHVLGQAGISFASFVEAMPGTCRLTSPVDDPYQVDHNPEVYFTDVDAASGADYGCPTTDIPFPAQWSNPLPSFSLVVPDACHNMHGTSATGVCPGNNDQIIRDGDMWLSQNVPALLDDGAIVIVTFDEGTAADTTNGGGHVLTVMAGPGVTAGTSDSTPLTHDGLLAGIERYFGVSPMLGGAASATALPIPPSAGLITSSGAISFDDTTQAAGLTSTDPAVDPLKGAYIHAAAWGDVDNDGDPDLFVGTFTDSSISYYQKRGATGPLGDQLFMNDGDGTFSPAGQPALNLFGRAAGAVFADLDNDGWNDLIVSNNSYSTGTTTNAYKLEPNHLFHNAGNGQFVDVSAGSGIAPAGFAMGRAVGVLDYDGDGCLDVFVVSDPFHGNLSSSRLLRGDCALHFVDVTASAGLDVVGGLLVQGLGVAVGDVNNDGWPDIFVAGGPLGFQRRNFLFVNRTDGTFREVSNGAFDEPPGIIDAAEDWTSGASFGDLNRDGLMDLVIGHHYGSAEQPSYGSQAEAFTPTVWLNTSTGTGDPTFANVTAGSGVVPIRAKAPHVEIQDFDNDGWPDIFVSVVAGLPTGAQPLVFRNEGASGQVNGHPTFSAPGFDPATLHYYPGGPTADYDRDGRLDVFLDEFRPEDVPPLFRNTSESADRRLARRPCLIPEQLGRDRRPRLRVRSRPARRTVGADRVTGHPGGQRLLIGRTPARPLRVGIAAHGRRRRHDPVRRRHHHPHRCDGQPTRDALDRPTARRRPVDIERRRDSRQRPGERHLVGSFLRWWEPDHRVHRHGLPRWTDGFGERLHPDGRRDGPFERHLVHVHGGCDERDGDSGPSAHRTP